MDINENDALWKRHADAEERRNLEELLATLSEDCVYELMATRAAYVGKQEAAEFYRSLWHAIPNLKMDVRQRWVTADGLVEEAVLSGEAVSDLFGLPVRGPVEIPLALVLSVRGGLITGERWYLDTRTLVQNPNPETL